MIGKATMITEHGTYVILTPLGTPYEMELHRKQYRQNSRWEAFWMKDHLRKAKRKLVSNGERGDG